MYNGTASAFLAGYLALMIGIIIVEIVAVWKVFEKADVAGWKAIIPFLNVWEMFKIAGVNPFFMLLMLVPFIAPFVGLYLGYKFVEAYGFSIGGFLLYVFLNPFMMLYMGFSNQVKYEGSYFEL